MVTTVIAYIWLITSIYYYFKPAQTTSTILLRVITVHVVALGMCVLSIGFLQPFALLFVLLFIEAYLYFGFPGLYASVILFFAAAFINVFFWYSGDPSLIVQNFMVTVAIGFLGLAVVHILSAQETSRRVLLNSQRRERLQYDRMVTIMNNLSSAAFTTDKNGTVLLYNAAALNLLDTNDSLRGKNIGTLFTLQDTTNQPVNLLTILAEATRTATRDDLTHTYSDKEVIRLELTYSPIRSGYSAGQKSEGQGGYIVLVRDITKQKSLEEQRDEFISVVSHELRTPITIVEGTLSNLSVMVQNPKQANCAALAENVTTAHDQVLYLARMVNDLSTLSRAERGAADTPEEIDVASLLQSMHQQYEHDALARKVQLNLELSPKLGVVNVSRLYLEELLQNFITNGIKYTQKGSVTIIATQKNGIVTFAVKDTGMGISRSDQQKIFQKFYRSEDYRIRETGGTGLGLYVASKLAHKLHTTIQVKSRLNHGSVFSFELPIEPSGPSR